MVRIDESWKVQLAGLMGHAANMIWREIWQNQRRVYLYYKAAADGKWGDLAVLHDDDPAEESLAKRGYVIADPRHFGIDMTRDQVFYRVKEICQRLPLIGG